MSELSLAQTSNAVGAPQPEPPVPLVLILTFSGTDDPPNKLRPPFLLNANRPKAVPAIPTIYSHRVVNSMQFFYELLYVTI